VCDTWGFLLVAAPDTATQPLKRLKRIVVLLARCAAWRADRRLICPAAPGHLEKPMNVRWMAVLTGYLADYFISLLIVLVAGQEFVSAPSLARPTDVLILSLLTLSTGIGGYVAGRMARVNRTINGFLVAIVGILVGQLNGPLPRLFVLASIAACGLAALGGYLSRFPEQRPRQPLS